MDPDIQNIKSGMIWKAISTALNAMAAFFMSVIFARFLGKDTYGELILVYAVVALFALLSNFGLSSALQRFIAMYIARGDRKRFTSFILTSIGLGTLFTSLFSIAMFVLADFISVNIFHRPSLALYMRWGTLYLFTFSLLTNILFSVYYGFERWKEECLLNTAYLFTSVLAVFIILAAFNRGVVGILKINAIVCLIGILAGISYIAKFIRPLEISLKFREFMSETKETLRFSTPILMIYGLFYIMVQFDKIILGVYRPAAEVAQYYIAVALGLGIIMFIKVAETVLTPYLAKFTGENNTVLKSKFQRLFRLFLHLPIVFLIFFYFLIDPFIRFAYGADFGITATALKIYLIVIVLRSSMMVIGLFLISVYGKTFEVTKISVVNALTHLIFYFVFVPKYGYMGALAAAIIAHITVWIYTILFVKQTNKLIPYRSLLYAAIGIAIVLGINFVAGYLHIYNKLILCAMLPFVYLSFVLLKGEFEYVRSR